MADNKTHFRSFAEDNQFSFKCPIFGAETKLASCTKLRNMMWRGKRPEVRQGCQACIRAGKCPVPPMMDNLMFTGEDPYFSAEPKSSSLQAAHIARIAPVIVTDRVLNAFMLTEKERELIIASNPAGHGGGGKLGSVVVEDVPTSKPTKRVSRSAAATEKQPESDVMAAATTGDMSAAITKAAAAKPTPQPAPAGGMSLLERAKLAGKQ